MDLYTYTYMYGFYMDLIWVYTDSYGIIWICIWFDMDLIWIYMDLYGFIWIYIYVWILRGFCMTLIWNYMFISFYIILYFLPSYSKSMRMISLSCFIPERCLWASLYIPGISLCIFVGLPHHINFWIQTNKKHYSHGTPKKALQDN